ncbi:MAG: hypothetical protein JJ863_03680 [Deltaproteobacteria bacterium]|nr:hypothetical protein [Deltaproteobacteria bacterium]
MDIKQTLQQAMTIEGAIGAAIVDYESGLTLGTAGGGSRLNIETAAAGNTEVVRSKMKVMNMLGIEGNIEDILITLGDQLHLIRPLEKKPEFFMYLAIDRPKGNLGMARYHLKELEQKLQV